MSYLFAFSCCSWGSQGKNTEVVCHSLLQKTTFCQTSSQRPTHLGWPLIAKFRLKLKKVWETTRPFKYDLNLIPYDYTVEVRNRFKRVSLIDTVHEEQWAEVHDTVQETGIKTIPRGKKCKKAKWLSEENLQIAVKRREVKSKGEKER